MKLELKLLQVVLTLAAKTENVFLVGGCVRDMLWNKPTKDYDVVTDLDIATINELFQYNGWSVKSVGQNFLVTIVSKDDFQFEIARFRTESGFTDGRRPDFVLPGTIEQDANRRDFTINAIYYDPVKDEFIDFHNGIQDLRRRTLRFIGDPIERIQEDYLRVFRFYRFLTTYKLQADRDSLKAARKLFNEAYAKTTPERVRAELEKLAGQV